MSDGSSDEDFHYGSTYGSRRYPVHDCCEFEDAESLRRLIFVRQDDSDDSSSCSSSSSSSSDDTSSTTSSDDNDSHDAAKRAAFGHSPVGIKTGITDEIHPEGDNGDEQKLNQTPTPEKNGQSTVTGSAGQDVEMEEADKVKKPPEGETTAASPSLSEAVVKQDGESGVPATGTTVSEPKDHKEEGPIKEDSVSPQENMKEKIGGDSVVTSSAANEEEKEGDVKAAPTASKSDSACHAEATTAGGETCEKSMEASAETGKMETSNESTAVATSGEHAIDETAKVSDQRPPKKKAKKKTPKPPKEPKYYCPYDLDERDEDENTPLHIAIHSRKLEHVSLLLEAGASPHRKCDGSAPIHTAISIAAIPAHAAFAYDCVDLLRNHGADMTAKDDSLHTPLYLACMSNLPRVVGLIISDPAGMGSLNLRSDRVGGRPLHAAAKFDLPIHGAGMAAGSTTADHHARSHHHHAHHGMHGGVALRGNHHHPGLHRTHGVSHGHMHNGGDGSTVPGQANSVCQLTQVLLNTTGVEVDSANNYGRTPLHIACMRGNWPVARMLLQAGANSHLLDHRGFTPGQLAMKRGVVIPNNLQQILGQTPPSSQTTPPRDLIMDPDSKTVILCHELCSRHRSCPPITRGGLKSADPPPENVRRLHVLINKDVGILKCGEFSGCAWESEARRAAMADVLKVHEYTYVEKISQLCSSMPDHPSAIAQLDPDTAVSRWSFESALRAAGSACEAVDKVMAGDFRNAFCAVRPPGHHAGPRGIVTCPNDPEGSHGFCLLNNVAIAAAYARTMYRNDGIRKVAIIDFDVHHGNGTEEIVRQLVPNVEQTSVRTPFAAGTLQAPKYKPWLDENDIHEVFFASTHGYGPRDIRFADQVNQGGWFYPASGKSQTTEAILSPSTVESPNLTDFLMSQTWTRMGEESRTNCCKIINVGLDLPRPSDVPGMQRVELRDSYRKNILPHLIDFDPDMIFISAGFDGHKKDTMNFGYVGMIEDDYEWVTEQLVKVANTCCNGRIVSVLEGGYKIHGGIVSPFARSVASHVRALVEGGSSRELFDKQESEWESQFERHMIEEKEKKRQLKIERLNRAAEMERRRIHHSSRQHHSAGDPQNHGEHDVNHDVEAMLKEPLNDHHGDVNQVINSDLNDGIHGHQDKDGEEAPTRKRRRNQVDYRELYEQMRKETLA